MNKIDFYYQIRIIISKIIDKISTIVTIFCSANYIVPRGRQIFKHK